MIDARTIFEIHRLKQLGWSDRKIARELRIDRMSVKKYLKTPMAAKKRIVQGSKLDPYRELIDQLLEQDRAISAPVVLQKLTASGFDGKITIVRDHLREKRGSRKKRKAYGRFESPPGKQMQLDWGHFGSLPYGDTRRKLYALVVIEAFSRMLFVRFTHSQNQAALHQGLLDAFRFFNGCPEELVVDNMATAVVERLGAMVRFNAAFLSFLRPFGITPVACNPGMPHEKGKVESGVKYLRRNFWPLRSFTDLEDVNRQVIHWLDTVANVRIHQGTGKRPLDRFEQVKLRPLPPLLPDCRQTTSALVHKDFAVRFDANTYSTPPWAIGKRVTLKADQTSVSLYLGEKRICVHPRCWQRKQRIETPSHRQQVKKLRKRLWHDQQVAAFISLGPMAVDYLEALGNAGQGVKKQVKRLLVLKDRYGAEALIRALEHAMAAKAWGADYVENIVHQQSAPKYEHPPVRLKEERLNRIRLQQPSLAGYDAHILGRHQK
jgi:transposase